MSFNTGSGVAETDRHVFVPDPDTLPFELKQVRYEKQKIIVAEVLMMEEDETIGNILKHELEAEKDKRVTFSAFVVPHPLEALSKLRFHVTIDSDPRQVLHDALERCLKRTWSILHQVENTVKTNEQNNNRQSMSIT